ncbi:MAG: hypothetical protein LBH14_03360, partial [Desulfobulbaceae bacterium]|nr:hypothetical protein [Desulfobulbaceae bacterium]
MIKPGLSGQVTYGGQIWRYRALICALAVALLLTIIVSAGMGYVKIGAFDIIKIIAARLSGDVSLPAGMGET